MKISIETVLSATEMDGTLHTDFGKSETNRDIKKYCHHHLNIFKRCINFQNWEGGAQKLGLPRPFWF
jgi:hypothetical protein